MTFPSGLHLHTRWGDGENTPEEMILAALERGFVSVGLSEHAFAPWDTACCIPEDQMDAYRDELLALKEQYRGRIEVYAGLEVDSSFLHDKSPWDYVVGSVHFVRGADRPYPIDHTPETFQAAIDDAGEGSVRKMLERYCESLVALALSYRPDILGHLDVIAKFNAGGRFFDPEDGWYLQMWENAVGAIADSGCIVEVNTGAMSRGYTTEPYPARSLLRMLRRAGVPLTLSSDAHRADAIDYAFPQAMKLLGEEGFSSVKILRGGEFTDIPIDGSRPRRDAGAAFALGQDIRHVGGGGEA